MRPIIFGILTVLVLDLTIALRGAAPPAPSVSDSVTKIVNRMKLEFTKDELEKLDVGRVEEFLTPQERHVLGTGHVSFVVNVPVTVSVVRDIELKLEPFWLREEGFRTNGVLLKESRASFDVWEKEFPAGPVGLGVNSLGGGEHHYFVLLKPRALAERLKVTGLRPRQLRVDEFKPGIKPYVDRDEKIETIPPSLEHQCILRTASRWADAAKLVHLFRWTAYPSSRWPDHVILTWSEDPKTTQTIQWRAGPTSARGLVAFAKKSVFTQLGSAGFRLAEASVKRLVDRRLVDDPIVHWHTATLRGLEPATTYVYAVGNGPPNCWTQLSEFTTAPDGSVPFSFVYMGDAQNGLERWGALLHNAFRARPDAAFYVMAGDLVNQGADRDDWDSFFHGAGGVYDRRPLIPALGNHDCQGGRPSLYLDQFELPRNGPGRVTPERAYAFEYSNALFLVLDSNLRPSTQTSWMEEQLSKTKATWKFVVYHHPAYSSASARDNIQVREKWTPIFDRYHVDLALQGHDHAYLRTYPIKAQQPVQSPAEGTIYVVSVSGTKRYPQATHNYTAVGLTNVATYQVLDVSERTLTYRAFDLDGRIKDEFSISK